jgi:hypothetical protein
MIFAGGFSGSTAPLTACRVAASKRNSVEPSFHFSLLFCMIFSDLALPAQSTEMLGRLHGFAQAGNRQPPRIKSGTSFFGIMR